jgi:hypothetical protein
MNWWKVKKERYGEDAKLKLHAIKLTSTQHAAY